MDTHQGVRQNRSPAEGHNGPGIITPKTDLTPWTSSLRYPQESNHSIHICLDPKDLNKVIITKHHKAPALDEITHQWAGSLT